MSSNIEVKLDVLNQKGSPALFASSLATRPAASFEGRLFVDSDNPSTGVYRDTGSAWIQIADAGAGTSGTLQQVTTNGNTTTIGIISNTVSLPLFSTLNSDSPYYFTSSAGNDFFKIFSAIGSTLDQTEMVFQVGDNGQPYSTGGERFRFNYNNSGGGTAAKDVFIIDYDLSYFNTNLGINTATPSSALDIHTATGINATFNGTGTTNSILQFQLAGTGKWNIGNLYNASANDFIIRDVSNSLNRITVKNTGQTFIGTDTTSSGLLVVNSATSDNHIVCIGANAPSIRLRNTGTSPTLNVGFGISTATNNFIQGSASGDYCIFNSNTTASPILFGIYNAGASNTQEAGRISAAQNFLFGGTSDNGKKLQVYGYGYFSNNIGINTVNTTYKLDVKGGNAATVRIDNDGSRYNQLIFEQNTITNSGADLLLDGTGSTFSIRTLAAMSIVFSTSASAGSPIERFRIKSTGVLNISSIPTSSVGLSSGDIYSNLGVLTIVP